MVNLRRLTQTAQKAKGVIDQQGGTDALKEKAQRMKTAAQGPGSMSDKAKAAASVAREKPNPASPTAGDDVVAGPIGGGDAPPDVAKAPPSPDPAAPSPPTAGASDAVEDPGPTLDPAASAPGETASEPVPSVPEEQADPPMVPPAPDPDDAKPNPDEPSESGKSEDR